MFLVLFCVQAIIIIPLAAELHKTRSAEGISVISEITWIVAGMGWSLYGFMSGSDTLVVSGFLATLGSAVVYGFARSDLHSSVRYRSAVFGLVFVTVMVLSAVLFGVVGLSVFCWCLVLCSFCHRCVLLFAVFVFEMVWVFLLWGQGLGLCTH